MAGRRVVAVAGTARQDHDDVDDHGRGCVTAGADPSFAIGGELTDGGANAHDGSGDVFVAEADESDGSFLVYAPEVSIITNVEPDHLDHYGTAEAVEAAFDAFADRVRARRAAGRLRRRPRGVAGRAPSGRARRQEVRVLTYGTSRGADVRRRRPTDVTGGRGAGSGRPTPGAAQHARPRSSCGCPGGTTRSTPRPPGPPPARPRPARRSPWPPGWRPSRGTRRRFEAKGEAWPECASSTTTPTTRPRWRRCCGRRGGSPGRVAWSWPSSRTCSAVPGSSPPTSRAALGLADEVVVLDVYAAREDPEPGRHGGAHRRTRCRCRPSRWRSCPTLRRRPGGTGPPGAAG